MAQFDWFTGFGIFACFFWLLGLAATVFWIWMLVDVLVSNLPTNEKILWALVIIFTTIIGALIYFFVARPSRPPAWGHR
jgi:hypothetical protein